MTYLGQNSLPYETFRIINKADTQNLYGSYNKEIDEPRNTEIFKMADEKAADIENKSGLTVALEDFAEVYNFNGSSSSNVCKEAAKPNFFTKVLNFFGIKTNIFKSETANNVIANNGNYYQNDILKDCIQEHGGLQYAKEGDDLFESAVNFAKADAYALGAPLDQARPRDERGVNYKLDAGEVNSYKNGGEDISVYDIKDLNFTFLDRDELNAKEVASYILATDTNQDGIITEEESLAAKETKTEDLIAQAKEIYEENK